MPAEKIHGTLYLIPTPLGEGASHTLPEYVKPLIHSQNHFIVENEKTARRFLKSMQYPHSLDTVNLYPIDRKTSLEEMLEFIKPLSEGVSIGLMSEAGMPGVADPGAQIVELAHQQNIKVVPLVGPSSIFLALTASGLNGQNFCFHGYLPIQNPERKKKISALEDLSLRQNQTQIFIETPYRNHQLLEDILAVCREDTLLCVACDLTLQGEFIKTKTIRNWKKTKVNIHKKPAVFLLQRK